MDRIGDILGRRQLVMEERARVRPEHSGVLRLVSDNAKARELMDWLPADSLDAGLERTVAYLREHLPQVP